MADEPKVIDPKDALEHGYWGHLPAEKDRDEYSVAGVTKAAADKPAEKPAEKPAPKGSAK